MKKFFLIAVVLLMMINFIINYHHEVTKEQHTPMADFKSGGTPDGSQNLQSALSVGFFRLPR